MRRIELMALALLSWGTVASNEPPEITTEDLQGGVMDERYTEEGLNAPGTEIDGLTEDEYNYNKWGKCGGYYGGNGPNCVDGRPAQKVCDPWPDCWDVRDDPEAYIEEKLAEEESEENGGGGSQKTEEEMRKEYDEELAAMTVYGSYKTYEQWKEYKGYNKQPEESGDPDGRDDDEHTIETSTIVSESMSMSCMNWRVVGGCVWYSWPYKISASVKVKHYIPDYVVSAYHEEGKNPWKTMDWVDDPGNSIIQSLFGYEPDGGHIGINGSRSDKSTNVMFKNTTAIGNPLASIWQSVGFSFFLCKSAATSFMPGYVSTLDNILWRTNPIEGVLYGIPQFLTQSNTIGPNRSDNMFGLNLTKWGYLYPRTGFVITQDDLKAGAITAQRTASILTSQGDLAMYHIANRPDMSGSSGWWPPKTVKEDSDEQGYWQMLLPKVENSCRLIGDMGETSSTVSRARGEGDGLEEWRSVVGDYVWNFWRPYKCCSKKGNALVFHFGE